MNCLPFTGIVVIIAASTASYETAPPGGDRLSQILRSAKGYPVMEKKKKEKIVNQFAFHYLVSTHKF